MFLGTVLKSARRVLAATGIVALAATALPHGASAQSIDDILSKKKLTVGMLVDLPPFGLLDTSGKPEGYDADVAKLMGKYLGVEVEIVPVTGPNRIPYLLTSKVDVLVATFGITPERAKQVQFSIPYSAIEIQLMGPKKLDVTSLEQTVGKKIAVARASTQDTAVTKAAPEGTEIRRFDDDASAMQALLSGQVDAIGCSVTVAAQIAKRAPAGTFENKFNLLQQNMGIAMRPGQAELEKTVNDFVAKHSADGELSKLYQKWLGTDLPKFQ